jgi:hypothetical protein
MLGKNPLWVANQHGHRVATMLSVYAAWVEGARECDVAAIRRAMGFDRASPAIRSPASAVSDRPPALPLASTPFGNLLTGVGTESDRLTIRVRVDPATLDTWDLKGETPRPSEPEPVAMGRRERSHWPKIGQQENAENR